MRARNIKPSLFKNEELADLGPYAVVLFEGLWCMADREGRLEDRPRRIRAEIMPYWDVDVDDLLANLDDAGFITRYTVDQNRFIQVVNFSKHQHPHQKEAESTIPAPDKPGASPVQAPDKPSKGSHGKNEPASGQDQEPKNGSAPKTQVNRKEPPGQTKSPPESQKTKHHSSPVQAPDKPGINPPDSGSPLIDTGYRIPKDCATAEPPQLSEQPFDIHIAFCEEIGADHSKLAPSFQSQQLGLAKQLIDDGFTVDQVRRCIRFMRSQSWRTGTIDLRSVKNEIGKWEANGEPSYEVKVKNGRPTTEDHNAVIDDFEFNLKQFNQRKTS